MPEPLRLPRLVLTEAEAAEALGVSHDTLLRERRRGRISYTLIGNRVRYTEQHLAEYLETRTVQCCAKETTALSSSANTGSANGPIPICGVDAGSIVVHDKRAAHLLAQATFKKLN